MEERRGEVWPANGRRRRQWRGNENKDFGGVGSMEGLSLAFRDAKLRILVKEGEPRGIITLILIQQL